MGWAQSSGSKFNFLKCTREKCSKRFNYYLCITDNNCESWIIKEQNLGLFLNKFGICGSRSEFDYPNMYEISNLHEFGLWLHIPAFLIAFGHGYNSNRYEIDLNVKLVAPSSLQVLAFNDISLLLNPHLWVYLLQVQILQERWMELGLSLLRPILYLKILQEIKCKSISKWPYAQKQNKKQLLKAQ